MSKKKPDKPEQQQPESDEHQDRDRQTLDETVRIDTVKISANDDKEADSAKIEETVIRSPAESTTPTDVGESEIERTTSPSDSEQISVYRGTDSANVSRRIDKTIIDPQQGTTVRVNRDTAGSAPLPDESVMQSEQISQTVNPRELSDNDVTLWNSAVGQSNQTTDSDRSPSEESYAERQFERLRQVAVAKLKSDAGGEFDYRLVRRLGQGGMGDVFVARQGSLDRLLALKLIKPLSGEKRQQLEKTGRLDSVEEERRQQFLSEAIVTGDLDHPNIVPIHDVGLTSDNQLFYAMKRVVGTPWSEVVKKRSLDENLEILLKASDAIGFAHTRGVVHRDIKPENIMLGDFGVVMVMDWGLALPTSDYEKQDSITATNGLGGTPAFMAPEMAIGPVDSIGPASDIYLLGATLFTIIVGKPPHFAKNVTECLQAVKVNKIRDVEPQHQGELMDIALKAMSTEPQNRFKDVGAFQAAIREYRAHAESITLAARAADDLAYGKQNHSYAELSRARFRFEESLESWSGNEKARQGLAETIAVHAESAYKNGDYDLGLSLLDQQNPEHELLVKQLQDGIRERDSRASRLSLLRKVAAAMLAFIVIGGSIALYNINSQRIQIEVAHRQEIGLREQAEREKAKADIARSEAERARQVAEDQELIAKANEDEAIEQKKLADQQTEIAVKEKSRADKQRGLAEQARERAEQERQAAIQSEAKAVAAKEKADYEEYVSKIGLAKARMERNEVDGAIEILNQLKTASPETTRNWEWRWLWRQAHQSQSTQKTGAAILDLSISGQQGVVVLVDGKVGRFTVGDDGKVSRVVEVALEHHLVASPTSVAIRSEGKQIAIGTRQGSILLIEDQLHKELQGHAAAITDLQYSEDGLLCSASYDKTVRVWDSRTGQELTKAKACWHISPVRQIAVAGDAESLDLVAAIADDSVGRVESWNLRRKDSSMVINSIGTFDHHHRPVSAIALSHDGRLVASGDVGGNVLLWEAGELKPIDYSVSLEAAISEVDQATEGRRVRSSHATASIERLIDVSESGSNRLVSTTKTNRRNETAHEDVVRTIRFSGDGTSVLTASDDHTLKLWEVTSSRLRTTFHGHGGWVIAADFVTALDDIVVSASNDATVRTWNGESYTGAFVSTNASDQSPPARDTDAHDAELTSATMSSDGTTIVTTSSDHTARVMQVDPQTLAFTETARLEHELLQEGSEYVAMSMHHDHVHSRLYVGSADGKIRVWDLKRGVEIAQASNTGLNLTLAVSKDGSLMLSGTNSTEFKAMLWQLDPKGVSPPRLLHRLKGHDQTVTAMAISNDSRICFTGDRDGRGILWNTQTGQAVGKPIDDVRGYRINAAAFNPDDSELIVGADDEQLTRIDLATRAVVDRLNHDGVVTQVALNPNGHDALALSELTLQSGRTTTVTLWNFDQRQSSVLAQSTHSDDGSGQSITSVRFDSSGKFASLTQAATTDAPARLHIYDLGSVQDAKSSMLISTRSDSRHRYPKRRSYELPSQLGTATMAMPVAEDTVLTMNKNGVFLWNADSRRLVKSYRPHAALTEASISSDKDRVVTASRSVKIWETSTGKPLGKIEAPHGGPIRTVQFAPKPLGKSKYSFATGGDDHRVRFWNWDDETRQATQVSEFDVGHPVRRIRFARNGEQVLVVGDSGLARLLSLSDQIEGIDFTAGTFGDLTSCAVSTDGTVVAVGGTDTLVRLWKIPKAGKPFAEPTILSGHADSINDIHLLGDTSDSLRVLTASTDDTARLWDARLADENGMGRELLSLRRHTTDVKSISATDNGHLMMTAGSSGKVILWPAGE